MGALYERAGTSAGVVATVRARVRRLLASACGLPPGVPDEDLGRAAAPRVSIEPAQLQAVLTRSAQAAGNPHLAPDEARRVVEALQRTRMALRAGRQASQA
jgi:hypothetical protein